ncbi:MAG: SusC/RagA family TonB-linked outer membrane protein, partial [Cyclobacteriaceae bacterium]|nr:SusC/RagA family TonB-linked outer membrane protein [Cyclobacteriaceae bacterium]
DESSVLVFSYIGYETQEETVGARQVIDISMTPDLTSLEEIVVIGYGEIKKRDLTGAVVSLSESEMTTGAAVTSAAQMLQGRAAGVEVSSGDGKPGGELSIVIRGNSSISNSTEPLYVVDGFPIAAGVSINPADIESIDILKDASAAAIYGSRGSSGVVLITTKRGKRGKVSVSYDGFAGVQQINNTIEFLDWDDYAANRNAFYADGPNNGNPWYTADDLALQNNTNWIDEGTRSAGIQSHTISATGGDETTRFSLSANSFNQEGVLLNTDFNRASVRLNVDRKFGKKANVGVNIYTTRTKASEVWNRAGFRGNSVMYSLLMAAPGRAAYNDDGSYGNTVFSRDNNNRPWQNPLGRMEVPERDISGFRTYLTLWADYEIMEGLVAKVNVGYDNTANTTSIFYPVAYSASGLRSNGDIFEAKSTSSLIEGTLSYTPSISEDNSLNILMGASSQSFDNYNFSARGRDFPTDQTSFYNLGSAAEQFIGSSRSANDIVSFFGRANYSFRDKYLLTATVRTDGASQLGTNNKWGVFPSASAAWRISDEDFLRSSNLVDNLKLRVAYGITGNTNFSPYTALARVKATQLFTYDGQSSGSGLIVDNLYAENPDLKWETSRMLNIGLDFGFWGSRMFGSAEVYNTNTVDLIIDRNLALSEGKVFQRANVGEMNNKGIELTLGGDILDGDFKWTASANLSKNINKITKLDGAPITLNIERRPSWQAREKAFRQMIEGGEMGDFYGYTYAGVIQPGETYTPQPNSVAGQAKYVDINGDGEITADDRSVIGNATPNFIWGLNNRFSYKGFSLDMFFQGVQGNEILNIRALMIDEYTSTRANERYSSINPTGTRPGLAYFYGEYGSYVNTEFIEDGSYVRLKNVVLTYKFNSSNISWLANAEIYVQAQNLLTFTQYSGFDPEVSFNYGGSSRAVGRGVDDNGFPNFKTYTAGIRLSF